MKNYSSREEDLTILLFYKIQPQNESQNDSEMTQIALLRGRSIAKTASKLIQN